LRAIFNGLPLPSYAWRKSGDDFVLIDYNEAAAAVTGGKVEQLLGTTLTDAYTSESEVYHDMHRAYNERITHGHEMDYTFLSTGETRRIKATYTFISPDLVLVYTEDITELTESFKRLEEEKERFRTLVEGISEALVAVDSNGRIFDLNTSAIEMFDYPREELIGKEVELLVPETKRLLHTEHREMYMQSPRTREMGRGFNLTAQDASGRTFPVEIGLNTVHAEDSISVIALITDITERMKTEEVLRTEALTDSLTGLFNRRAFEDQLAAEENRVARGAKKYSIIIADIDHFKSVNDTYGHGVGDEILRHITRILHAHIRRADTLARWGGEEFIILLPETDLEGSATSAEKLRASIETSPARTSRGSIGVSMSFGTAVIEHGETKESVISRADEKLYAAKNAGRNCVMH
jgi:diguanylate cyclase (GGDEF)-like protein/PAS domain S-box-containing protein